MRELSAAFVFGLDHVKEILHLDHAEVLAAADYVSCSNDEDGVAKALEHFGLA